MIELTKEQKVVLEFYKALGAKWLAVDSDGREYFYSEKPIRSDKEWRNLEFVWNNQLQEYGCKSKLGLITWKDEPVNIDWLLRGINANYWRELPIDTNVEFYHKISGQWFKSHYAGFENDKICCFKYGQSSWTSRGEKIELEIDEIRVCE